MLPSLLLFPACLLLSRGLALPLALATVWELEALKLAAIPFKRLVQSDGHFLCLESNIQRTKQFGLSWEECQVRWIKGAERESGL